MRKRHETFVCRKTENTELMRCICGLCEAEALRTDNTECRIANTALQSSVAQLRARVKELESVNELQASTIRDHKWDELLADLHESSERVRELEDALKHYTNVTNADGYPIGGVAALALAASSSPAQGKEALDDKR